MKKFFVYTGVVLATAVVSFVVFMCWLDEEPVNNNAVRLSIESKILSEKREVIVTLPREYDSTKVYPVMYVVDGGSFDANIANVFNVLTSAGYVDETIIVGIPNISSDTRERDLTPPFMRRDNDDPESETGAGDTFVEFIRSELIPFVENEYRTSDIRILCGNSRGGLFVMYTLLHDARLFAARFCFSTPFWRQDAIMVSKMNELIAKTDSLKTFIYMSAGSNETNNIKDGMSKMNSMLKQYASRGVVSEFDYTPEAGHQNNAALSVAKAVRKWSEYKSALTP